MEAICRTERHKGCNHTEQKAFMGVEKHPVSKAVNLSQLVFESTLMRGNAKGSLDSVLNACLIVQAEVYPASFTSCCMSRV
jgi:hypothetical protein